MAPNPAGWDAQDRRTEYPSKWSSLTGTIDEMAVTFGRLSHSAQPLQIAYSFLLSLKPLHLSVEKETRDTSRR